MDTLGYFYVFDTEVSSIQNIHYSTTLVHVIVSLLWRFPQFRGLQQKGPTENQSIGRHFVYRSAVF